MTSDTIGVAAQRRQVGFLLGIGILCLPFIFVWFLLKPGYTTFARVVGFGWLALAVLFVVGSRTELLRALASSDGGNYAAAGGVLGFKPKWRAAVDEAENYSARVAMCG